MIRKWPKEWSPTKKRRARAMAQAKRDHALLIKVLGGVCVWCEETIPNMLTIDHVDGRQVPCSQTNNLRWDVRVREYLREFDRGVKLRVLCRICNSIDGRRRQMESDDLPEAPF